jgi:hypothetical protein
MTSLTNLKACWDNEIIGSILIRGASAGKSHHETRLPVSIRSRGPFRFSGLLPRVAASFQDAGPACEHSAGNPVSESPDHVRGTAKQ